MSGSEGSRGGDSGVEEDYRFDACEEREVERRWEDALRELRAMLDRRRDIRVKPRAEEGLDPAHERELREMLARALRDEDRPELKRRVARRMADKLGQYFLYNRVGSIPVIHELIALLPWWLSQIPGDAVARLRDIGLANVLNGAVIPVQSVLEEVLVSRRVYMGHCVCRSSGIADDHRKGGEVFSVLSEKKRRLLLDRIVDRYEALRGDSGVVAHTAERYQHLFLELTRMRDAGDSRYRLETLLDRTHGDWEILPVHEKYTPDWVRSMHANYKAHLLHRELVFDLATIFYLARGCIFTSMRMFDTPYTICSCPTPENGGGCVLTNWYYWGRSNASLLANESVHGRRRDEAGNPLPCKYFPVRKRRDCLGCGCDFRAQRPRSVEIVLAEADRIYAGHAQRGG